MTRAPAVTPAPTPSTEVDMSLTELISENLQMQAKDGVPYLSVRAHAAEWERAGASSTILKIIKKGLTAALTGQPKLLRYVPSNVPDSVLHEQVATGAARYLTKTEEQKTQHWTPVFLRPKPNGKARLITDCRRLNKTATAPTFKQNVLQELQQALYGARGWHGSIVDYKRAFHHVQVDPALGRWMRIRGQETAIQLEAMPFGYGPSPYWWFKLTRVPLGLWRAAGMVLVIYVDDLFILGRTPAHVRMAVALVIATSNRLGLWIGFTKCHLEPSQIIHYLGYVFWMVPLTFRPEEEMVTRACAALTEIINHRRALIRKVAKIAGLLTFMAPALPGLHGLAKALMCAAARKAKAGWHHLADFSAYHPLMKLVRYELREGLARPLPHRQQQQWTLQTDACGTGWGATLTGPVGPPMPTRGAFTPEEQKHHITHKETWGTTKAVEAYLEYLPPGAHLTVLTDATTNVAAINKGSTVVDMNEAIRPVAKALATRGISWRAQHLPGESMGVVDTLSRVRKDQDDYQFLPFARACQFHQVQPQLDMFATDVNKQCHTFWAARPCPGAAALDALSQPWGGLVAWANPPWGLMGRVLQKAARDPPAVLLLVVPVWKTAPWWPDLLRLAAGAPLLVDGPCYRSYLGLDVPQARWRTAVYRLGNS
jgi:hypothetical protein